MPAIALGFSSIALDFQKRPKMKATVPCVLSAFFMVNSTAGPAQETLAELAKERLKVAEKTFKEFVRSEPLGLVDYKMYYSLSRRLLDAQRDLDSSKENQLRAFEGHLERMVGLEKTMKKRIREGAITASARYEGEYFRVEARFWLEKAKTQLKK